MSKRFLIAILFGAFVLVPAAQANNPPTLQELQNQLNALNTQVNDLKTKNNALENEIKAIKGELPKTSVMGQCFNVGYINAASLPNNPDLLLLTAGGCQ